MRRALRRLALSLLGPLLALGCGAPPPNLAIGHCSAGQVEAQRAEFLAAVVPAVTACATAGAPEDCPVADAATERWMAERESCR